MNKISLFLINIVVLLSLISVPFETYRANKANELMKYTIVVDPGHGGKDNGCINGNVYEDEINLEIAKCLYEDLVSKGFMVYLTRYGDYDLASEYALNRKNEDLRKRVSIINSFQANILISLHTNYYQNQNIYGPMVYYRVNDENSRLLALEVQDKLNKISNLDKIIHSEDFYLFRKTSCLALLIECGFISNPEEKNKLVTPTYHNIIAKQISDGVISYLKIAN